MTYAITRQLYWPEGTPVVEVAEGGLDYTNPDALSARYPGEFTEVADPREAVRTAVAILRQWRADGTRTARLAIGCTSGLTLPFDPITIRDAQRWARSTWEQIPKCDQCGDILPESSYYLPNDPDGGRYCSEVCADSAYAVRYSQDGDDA